MHFYDNVRLHFDRTWNDCLFYRLAFFFFFCLFFFTQWSFVHKRNELSGALSSIFVTDTHSQWLTILFKKKLQGRSYRNGLVCFCIPKRNRLSRINGNNFPSSSAKHKHTVKSFRQLVQKLHICWIR